MQDCCTHKGKHLTRAEPRNTERCPKEGCSNREISRRLAKAPQTIHNEVKRGQVRQQVRKRKYELVYSADFAQKSYVNNCKHSANILPIFRSGTTSAVSLLVSITVNKPVLCSTSDKPL